MTAAFIATRFPRFKAISLKIASHAKELKNYVAFVKIDVENNSETVEACKIIFISSFQFYEGGFNNIG